jgi:hypothetical protein
MLIFFDFSDNQKQTDYAQQRGKVFKLAHNPIYAVPNAMLMGHCCNNDVTANTQTNRATEALFDQFID